MNGKNKKAELCISCEMFVS